MLRVVSTLLLLAACGGESPDPVPAAPPPPDVTRAPATPAAVELAEEAAADAARSLGSRLKSTLMASLSSKGAAESLQMCSQEAQGLTALVAGEQRARVGRTSDRLRNPANAGPEWARAWLASVADKPPAEVTPYRATVEVEGGRVARFAAPILVAEPCLACHGEPAPDVAARLAALYPQDRATGYAVGDLRGVIWSEVAVGPPP